MPEFPDFPSENDEERAPDPERIIDRIINGQLVSLPQHRPDTYRGG